MNQTKINQINQGRVQIYNKLLNRINNIVSEAEQELIKLIKNA